MSLAVLALGANLGDPPAQIAAAVAALDAHPDITVLAQSLTVVTPPWGKADQPDFHNAAVLVETTLDPLALLDMCLAVEDGLGRIRGEKWGPRIIDIDVIAYETLEMESERLTLPHPHAHERDFVLGPVREIAPEVAEWILIQKARNSG